MTELDDALAAPDDDALRRRYAETAPDGDVRAELIRLQDQPKLSSADRKAIATLTSNHRRALIGPLDEVLKKKVTYRLGFLQSCEVKAETQLTQEQAESPLWNTVEAIDLGSNRSVQALGLPSLEALRGIALFPSNAEDPWRCDPSELRVRPKLRELELSDYTPTAGRVFALHECFPQLERLELRLDEKPEDADAPLDTPLARGLKEIRVRTDRAEDWSRVFIGADLPDLGRIEIECGSERKWAEWVWTRDGQGFSLAMKLTDSPKCSPDKILSVWRAAGDSITDCKVTGKVRPALHEALTEAAEDLPFSIELDKLKVA